MKLTSRPVPLRDILSSWPLMWKSKLFFFDFGIHLVRTSQGTFFCISLGTRFLFKNKTSLLKIGLDFKFRKKMSSKSFGKYEQVQKMWPTWYPRKPSLSFCLKIIYYWLSWVFTAVHRLSVVAVSGVWSGFGVQVSHWGGFPCCRAWTVGVQASEVVAHRLNCPVVCGIFTDQGTNPYSLHWQADS